MWITLGPDAQLVEQGLPDLGPALSHSSEMQPLLSASTDILRDVAGEAFDTITITHDPEWELFPELGAAVKEAGGQEECMCVAQCADPALWALGLGSRWKNREQAARLAMSLALAASNDVLASGQSLPPEFLALCERASIMTGGLGGGEEAFEDVPMEEPEAAKPSTPPRARAGKRWQQPAGTPELSSPPAEVESKQAAGWKTNGRKAAQVKLQPAMVPPPAAANGNGSAKEGKLPRDTPMWISLPAFEMPDQLGGMSPIALVLSSEGKGRKGGLYAIADRAVGHLLGEDTQVEYVDDANWDIFPRIGQALKEIATAEECMTVAVCPERDLWAVGVGMKGKDRYTAAKAAFAASLALQIEEMGEEADLSEFPALVDFVEEARAARG